MRHIRLFLFVQLLFILVSQLSACGLFGANDANAYKATKSVAPIAVPQQLKLPQGEHTLVVPEVNAVVDTLTDDIELPPQIVKLADIEKKVAEENAKADAGVESSNNPDSGGVLRQPLKSQATKNELGSSLLIVDASLGKVWPNMAPALKELGFNVDDANRGDQVFTIVKELPTFEEKELELGEEEQRVQESFQIHLKSLDDKTQITVHNKYGKLDGSALADHLLLQIQERIENPDK